MTIQQQQSDLERRAQEERCADCKPGPGWSCHTLLEPGPTGGRRIYLGCYLDALTREEWREPRYPRSADMKNYSDCYGEFSMNRTEGDK